MQTSESAPIPLSDTEFDKLSQGLKAFGGKHAMNLETLDGFLAALVCGPDDVPPNEFLREIWGDNIVNGEKFIAQPILQDFVSLITRHWNFIDHTLRSGEAFTPLLLQNEQGIYPANGWATGFMRGLELRRKEWASFLNDEDHAGSLVPIFALVHEHDLDPETRSYAKPVDAQLREKLIVGIAAGVMKIHRYFEARRLRAMLDDSTTYRRITPKVGRNDPCPCGSGKKFKQCCGAITLH